MGKACFICRRADLRYNVAYEPQKFIDLLKLVIPGQTEIRILSYVDSMAFQK